MTYFNSKIISDDIEYKYNDIPYKTYLSLLQNFSLFERSLQQTIKNYKSLFYEYFLNIYLSDIKFIDLCLYLEKKYNIKYFDWNNITKDLIQFITKLFALYMNIPEILIKERYSDNYSEVEERMMFRIELYKFGWTQIQIENYINKYILKNSKKTIVTSFNCIDILYTILRLRLGIQINNIIKKVGRPILPNNLKIYIQSKNRKKVKESMKLTYKYYQEYKNLKDNLLNESEYNLILSLLSKNNNELLKEKLKKLKKE
jgi:hypothetical protein